MNFENGVILICLIEQILESKEWLANDVTSEFQGFGRFFSVGISETKNLL